MNPIVLTFGLLWCPCLSYWLFYTRKLNPKFVRLYEVIVLTVWIIYVIITLLHRGGRIKV